MKNMEPIKITLCPACSGSPAFEITDDKVTISVNENTVTLTDAEWNDLVARIRRGELSEV
jgi:hypothetical protein